MSFKLSRSGAAVVALACSALSPWPLAAAPVVIAFDNQFTAVGPGQADASYTEQGYVLTPTGGDALIGESFCSFPDFCAVGNTTAFLATLNDAGLTLTAPTRPSFTLLGFSAAFMPSPFNDYSGMDIRLQLSGTTVLGVPVAQVFSLLEAGNGDYLFSDHVADSALTDLRALTFSACFFDGVDCVSSSGLLTNDAQFAIDDIRLVPEPGVGLLAVLCLLGSALPRRTLLRPSKG